MTPNLGSSRSNASRKRCFVSSNSPNNRVHAFVLVFCRLFLKGMGLVSGQSTLSQLLRLPTARAVGKFITTTRNSPVILFCVRIQTVQPQESTVYDFSSEWCRTHIHTCSWKRCAKRKILKQRIPCTWSVRKEEGGVENSMQCIKASTMLWQVPCRGAHGTLYVSRRTPTNPNM